MISYITVHVLAAFIFAFVRLAHKVSTGLENQTHKHLESEQLLVGISNRHYWQSLLGTVLARAEDLPVFERLKLLQNLGKSDIPQCMKHLKLPDFISYGNAGERCV